MRTLISIIILIFFVNQTEAQIGKTITKLANKAESEILGEKNKQSEPDCACSNASTIFKFSEKFKINYTETEICVSNDGKILLMNKEGTEAKYYISDKGGVSGPFEADDAKVKQFGCFGDRPDMSEIEYVKKQGDKFLIEFGGKSYGPFAEIQSFYLTRSKKKFAAIVLKNSLNSEADVKAIEAKMKNATPEQQMAFAMELSQKMQKQMQQQSTSGDGFDLSPRLVTNIGGIEWNPMSGMQISSTIKYDDICLLQYDKVTDLNGKKILGLTGEVPSDGENLWINADNSKYAWFNYGVLQFSDGKKLEKVFSPLIIKEGSLEYIGYMYYSPGDDAIKMCKIPF